MMTIAEFAEAFHEIGRELCSQQDKEIPSWNDLSFGQRRILCEALALAEARGLLVRRATVDELLAAAGDTLKSLERLAISINAFEKVQSL
jgi:hypothetical protein